MVVFFGSKASLTQSVFIVPEGGSSAVDRGLFHCPDRCGRSSESMRTMVSPQPKKSMIKAAMNPINTKAIGIKSRIFASNLNGFFMCTVSAEVSNH